MTKVYDNATDLITFARLQSQNTTSGSSYLGSDGLLKFAAEDEPRIEYAADGSLKGLLIEEQRSNLIANSGDISLGTSKQGGVTVESYSGIASPDGSEYGVYRVAGPGYAFYPGIVGNNQFKSLWVRTVSGTGTVALLGYHSLTKHQFSINETWQRVSVASDTTDTGGTGFYAADFRYGDLSEVLLWGPQLEQGSFATSYIPTSGSQSTRSPDIASIPVSSFGYNQSAGTVVVDYSTFHTYTGVPYPRAVNLAQAGVPRTGVEVLAYFADTSLSVYHLNTLEAGGSTNEGGGGSAAIAFAQDNVQFAKDGSLVGGTDTSATIAPYTVMYIGASNSAGGNPMSGHIKSIQYFPRRLTDAQLQELTS